MYTTIEADIENGRIIGPESRKLPAMAHVLITLLNTQSKKRPEFGTRTSAPVKVGPESFAPLSVDYSHGKRAAITRNHIGWDLC